MLTGKSMLKGRATCTTTVYQGPSYDAAKLDEVKEGSTFWLVAIQQENQVNWCKVQLDDGRVGYLVGFLVEVLRECSTTKDNVPFYNAHRTNVGILPRGTIVSAWLPPESDSD